MEKNNILLMAYGTPSKKEDVGPYLKDIFNGKEVPQNVVEETLEKYEKIGFSPLKSITEEQAVLLERNLAALGHVCSVSIGMKHWHPRIEEVASAIKEGDPEKVIGMIIHPFKSVMGSEEYKKMFFSVFNGLDAKFIDSWYSEEVLYDAWSDNIKAELRKFSNINDVFVIFTSHGLPSSVEDKIYKTQLEEFSSRLAEMNNIKNYCLAYQNGSHTNWYAPEVTQKLTDVKDKGFKDVLIVPIGYLSDSLETLYDIDIGYKKFSVDIGINMHRASCLNLSDKLISAMSSAIVKAL